MLFLTGLLFFLSLASSAQEEWAPAGARWYYTTPYVESYETTPANECTLFEATGEANTFFIPLCLLWQVSDEKKGRNR